MKLSKNQKRRFKTPLYLLEFILAWLFMKLLRVLPFKVVSSIGSCLGKMVGLFIRRHVARTNLRWAFPNISDQEMNDIIGKMYDNFGRTFIEFIQLDQIDPAGMGITITVKGHEWIDEVKNSGKGAIFFSGHYGNWEVGPWIFSQYGLPLTPIYRHLNNPYLDHYMRRLRLSISPQVILKGPRSGQECFRALKKGQSLVLLADQKMNEGVEIPFFGRLASTPVGIAKLAMAANVPILPTRVKRIGKTDFELTVYPPLEPCQEGDPTITIMTQVNQYLESWIREAPEQWFWVHRRWRKEDYYENPKS
jgi:Kdo2-lipid IVA lauroyltransferase/acyltransferase